MRPHYLEVSEATFQSTPPTRGATPTPRARQSRCPVSIHAPHAGGDRGVQQQRARVSGFNPRPPRGGRRGVVGDDDVGEGSFNPRPPRGGRRARGPPVHQPTGFNPRPPRGGRREAPAGRARPTCFNPRPPRGGRQRADLIRVLGNVFQSTPPTRGATLPCGSRGTRHPVSIHAPHAGGDALDTAASVWTPGFQSTPPTRGATRMTTWEMAEEAGFNPRPPRGGRRGVRGGRPFIVRVSIHAPHAGGDPWAAVIRSGVMSFNPRPPRGGRPVPWRQSW